MRLIRKKLKPPKRVYRDNIVKKTGSQKNKGIRKFLTITVIILFILFFITGQRGSYKLYKFSRQLRELEIEIAKISEEIKKLEEEKEKINNDPAYIEKIAREKYKMKKEGEQVYQIIEE